MTSRPALSITPFAAELLAGPLRPGVGLGHGYIRFGDDVLALTPPGAPRMPNGIEVDVEVAPALRIWAGDGALRSTEWTVGPGPLWEPRPEPRYAVVAWPRPELDLETLPGLGPGLTPFGDDVLIGYLAGRALAGFPPPEVVHAADRTTALSRTLLLLAAGGALPEPAHKLLVDGDFEPLLAFGASSGKGITLGLSLASGATRTSGGEAQVYRIRVPLPGGARDLVVAATALAESRTGSGRHASERPQPAA